MPISSFTHSLFTATCNTSPRPVKSDKLPGRWIPTTWWLTRTCSWSADLLSSDPRKSSNTSRTRTRRSCLFSKSTHLSFIENRKKITCLTFFFDRFSQKAEQAETRDMCRMCVGDAEDAAEFVPVDEIKGGMERANSMASMSGSESSPTSPLSSARDRSDSESVVRPSTSSSSILIQNAAFLTKNPANHERLVDWLRAEIPNHKFFLVVVFRGSWCGFCAVSLIPYYNSFQ